MKPRRICCHQTAIGIGHESMLCTDACCRTFPTRAAWIDAIQQAADTLITQATVAGTNDKIPGVGP